jgi:hypothetical protein
MTIPPELLEYLHASDLTELAEDAEGHFPFAELEDAVRSGEASMDLVDWLHGRYERFLRTDGLQEEVAVGPVPAFRQRAEIHAHHPAGTRMDRPPMGDEKNYEQGPPSD